MANSAEGLGGMSRTFHHFYLDHLCRSEWAKKKRPLLINSWEAAFFDFDDDKLVEFAKGAKERGIDMLVMDDGWFGDKYPRNKDNSSLGDWMVDARKLPRGIEGLIADGKAVILISSYLPEVMGLSDRLMVMYEGKQTGIIERDEFYNEDVKLRADVVLCMAAGI